MSGQEAALREADWRVREEALDNPNLIARIRYERVTFGLEGPGEKRKADLDKIADSAGRLVLAGSRGMSFNNGYIGHVADVSFETYYDLYCLDHIPGDIVGAATRVVLDVPNLTDCQAHGANYFNSASRKYSFQLMLGRKYPSARAEEGRIKLFETIAIAPHIDHFAEDGTAVYDFSVPFSSREIWKEYSFGSVFHTMREPMLLFGSDAEAWVNEHAMNSEEFWDSYYERSAVIA